MRFLWKLNVCVCVCARVSVYVIFILSKRVRVNLSKINSKLNLKLQIIKGRLPILICLLKKETVLGVIIYVFFKTGICEMYNNKDDVVSFHRSEKIWRRQLSVGAEAVLQQLSLRSCRSGHQLPRPDLAEKTPSSPQIRERREKGDCYLRKPKQTGGKLKVHTLQSTSSSSSLGAARCGG